MHSAEAEMELARHDLERTRDLAQRKVVSKAELDAAESKFKQKLGAVAIRCVPMIRKKTMRGAVRWPARDSPGERRADDQSGQQVVPLTSLDPVFVDFALPQQDLGKLSNGLEVHVTTDALPGRVFDGKLTAINSMVDVGHAQRFGAGDA